MTVAIIETSNVTNEQIGACTRVFDAAGKPFYKVVNSKQETDDAGHLIEYSVKAIRRQGKWFFTCDCKAGQNARQCWHVRASLAAATEEKAAMAEQVALNAAAVATPVKPFIPTPTQEEIDRFWAFRPELMDKEEREAFATRRPDLVEEYSEVWAEYLVK